MKEHIEVLEKTMKQMPPVFTSYQFNTIAKLNGYPSTLLKGRGLSKFIHQYATNGSENSKTWVKANTGATAPLSPTTEPLKKVTDTNALNQKYLQALKIIHQSLQYSDKINLANVINDFGLSKDIYKPLQDGGIIKTNGKAGNGCRYHWITKAPSLEMAIELRDRVGRNSVKRQPKEVIAPKPIALRKAKPQTKTTVKSYFWGLFKTTHTNC